MKKIKLEGKLNLQKSVVSRLNTEQMTELVGGKVTDHACRTRRICEKTTVETWNTVSIACVHNPTVTETIGVKTIG